MRIMAHHSYKNNGDTYSVTFETTGDVSLDQSDSAVDDLFRRAREAIARQTGESNNGAQKNGGQHGQHHDQSHVCCGSRGMFDPEHHGDGKCLGPDLTHQLSLPEQEEIPVHQSSR